MQAKNKLPTLRNYNILFIISICVLTIGLCHCRASDGTHSKYKTVRITKQRFSLAVTALGTVKPQVGAEVRLGARIPGKVEQLRANIGDLVTKGQVIAELETDELEAYVEKRKAEYNTASFILAKREALGPIEIEKAEAERIRFNAIHDLAAADFERQEALFKENLSSQQALDRVQEDLQVAKKELETSIKALELTRNRHEGDLKQLTSEIEKARAELKVAEVELSYAILRAPISGTIASVSTQEGETVAVGLSAPTFVTIIDLERLQVETYVDEVGIGKIKIGQKAAFIVEAFPSIEIEGEVVAIYPKALLRENVVFYNVVVRNIQRPAVALRPEMTANVSIFLEPRDDVLVVPTGAVKKSGGSNFVYVLEDGKPVRRDVSIGWRQGRYLEITEGLKEGDEVLEDHSELEEEA